MKYYLLSYLHDGKVISVKKVFKSRNDAINYMFNKVYPNIGIDVQVNEEIEHSKHDIEYVSTDYERFYVCREIA